MITKIKKYVKASRDISQHHFRRVSDMPVEKIVIGTTIAILPGGVLISGVYLAQKKYREYTKNTENPESFFIWLGRESSQYVSNTKDETVKAVDQYVTQAREYTADKVEKVTSSIKKKF